MSTTITKLVDAYCTCAWDSNASAYVWSDWLTPSETVYAPLKLRDMVDYPIESCVLFKINGSVSGPQTSALLESYFSNSSGSAFIMCRFLGNTQNPKGSDPNDYEDVGDGVQTRVNMPETKSFGVETSLDPSKTAYVLMFPTTSGGPYNVRTNAISTQHVDTTLPTLGMSLVPNTLGAGSELSISFSNRESLPVTLKFKSGSTLLYELTINADTASGTPPRTWFDTVGGTSTSMSVSVTATDAAGRTASGSFTLKQTLVATPAYPKNTTHTGVPTFGWYLAGGTSQTKAQVYIEGLGYFETTGSYTSLTPSQNPPPGTVRWAVRSYNDLGYWGPWSDYVSYTQQYSSTSYLAVYSGKTSGTLDRFTAASFSVQMRANGTPYQPWTIHNPVFYWRQSTNAQWTAVNMTVASDNKTASVTIAANAFAKGTLYWKVEAQDQDGNTRTVGVYTLSTVAAKITATPAAPIDTIETSNTPTEFSWRNSGPITIYPASAELQYSVDNATWETLGSVSGTATSCTVPAGTVPGGQIYWRVRVTNVDDIAGEWSSSVSFQNFGAPVVINITVNDRPYATITWGSSTQESYKVIVDGKTYGPYFGPDMIAFTLPEPLEDGSHHAGVMVQNEYSQWSEPLETDFTVTNVPGTDITLGVTAGIDAALFWSAGDDTEDYVVYRDGKAIGHTDQTNFLDRVCLGAHEWHVLERLPDGYYTKSNVVSGVLALGAAPKIALLSGGDWLSLDYSENSRRTYRIEETQEISEKAVMGAEYPEVEVSPYKSLSVGMDAAWLMSNLGFTVLRSLVGKALILKLPHDIVVIGVLRGYSGKHGKRIGSYEYTLRQMRWRDYINA